MTISRRRLFTSSGTPEPIEMIDAVVGDICLYDNVDQSMILIKKGTLNSRTYPITRYTPIGVVAVPEMPAYHGDWSCSVISLKAMDYNNPDNGTSEITASSGMNDFTATISNYPSIISTMTYVGYDDDGDKSETKIQEQTIGTQTVFTGLHSTVVACDVNFDTSNPLSYISNPYDSKSKYVYRGTDDTYTKLGQWYYCISPYTSFFEEAMNKANIEVDESLLDTIKPNPILHCERNYNYDTILDYATSQPNWKTDTKITDSYASGYCPLYCCIWRFHTIGTKQGDWYLPSFGETALIICRLMTIDETINEIKTVYGDNYGITLYDELENGAAALSTSTFFSTSSAWKIYANGQVVNTSGDFHGRPLLQLNDPNPPSIG